MIKTQRNTKLFIFQIILSLFVITIHMEIGLNNYEIFLQSIGRTTVLFFFMLSGYFYYSKNADKRINDMYRGLPRRILRLYLLALIVLFITFSYKIVFECHLNGTEIMSMLNTHFTIRNLFDFVIFGNVDVANHLWFIFNLVYVYLLTPILIKIFNKKYLLMVCVSILLLVFAYFYTAFFKDIVSQYPRNFIYTRNWFFEGIPCFIIGFYIFLKKESLKKLFSNKKTLICLIVLSALLVFVDSFFVFKFKYTIHEFYLFSPFLAFFLITYSTIYHKSKVGDYLLVIFGKNCSTIIYLFHPLFCHVLSSKCVLNNQFFTYILIFTLTVFTVLLLSALFNYLSSKMRNRKNVQQ